MLVWQTHDQNEWAVEIDRALETETNQPITVSTLDPFSLGEPTAVRRVLTETDFEAIGLTSLEVPVFYGRDVETAFGFVSSFRGVRQALDSSHAETLAVRLRATLAAHESQIGVFFGSKAWIVTARRRSEGV